MNNAFVNTAVFNLHKKIFFLDLLKQSLDNLWRKKTQVPLLTTTNQSERGGGGS